MILPCNPSSVRGYDQFVTSADQLVGQSARRSLVANRPIRPLDIGQPVLISRGQLVAVLYQTDNMALTATGKAMENAGMNQTITVVNGQSNRTIQAVVTCQSGHRSWHATPVLRQSQLSTTTDPIRTSLALPSDGR
jgi:flagella basal body P-ring formation protein FlgA